MKKSIRVFISILFLSCAAQNALAAADAYLRGFYNGEALEITEAHVLDERKSITLWASEAGEGNLRLPLLRELLSNAEYMTSDNVYTPESCRREYQGELQCELALLTAALPHINFSKIEGEQFVWFVTQKLNAPYQNSGPEYEYYDRLAVVAASLLSNRTTGAFMQKYLLDAVKTSAYEEPFNKVWAALALSKTPRLPAAQRAEMKKELEEIILSLSGVLKYQPREEHWLYEVYDAAGYTVTNQQAAAKSFMYSLSFFAEQRDDGYYESLYKTGMFVDRSHYFQNDAPGVDKDGYFLPHASGHRHNIAFQLIRGLFSFYMANDMPQEINNFIVTYAKANAQKTDFENYVMFAAYALEEGFQHMNRQNYDAWLEQYNVFAWVISRHIMRMYPAAFACVTVQGAAEVCAEWTAIGEVFGGVLVLAGAGFRSLVKAGGKILPQAAANLISEAVSGVSRFYNMPVKIAQTQVPVKMFVKAAAVAGVSAGLFITIREDFEKDPGFVTMTKEEASMKTGLAGAL